MTKNNQAPEIRFGGFTKAWEQRKLSDVVNICSGRDYKHLFEGKIPVYGTGGYMLSVNKALSYDRDAIGIGRKGTIDKPYILKAPFWTVDTLFYAIPEHSECLNFVYDVFQIIDWKKKDESTGVPSLSKETINNTDIAAPKIEEQLVIGDFFAQLDDLITLHQRKYDKLLNVKKSCLEKMFPKNGSKVPEIRFAGFTEAWKQRKFADVFNFLQNNTLSRADLSEENGAAKNIHYGDVLIKFGEYLDVTKERLSFITTEEMASKFRSSFLRNGDIIIADTAEDETVGKCCEIANSRGDKLVSGLHTMPCRPNQKYASGYLGYYMNSPSYHDQLLPLMQGTKVISVSKTAISDTVLMYPVSEAEQAYISRYLQSMDHLISLHQRKLEKLQNIKKSMLKKMFV